MEPMDQDAPAATRHRLWATLVLVMMLWDGVGQSKRGQKSLVTGTAQPTLLLGLTQEGPHLWRERVAPADYKEKLKV